MSLIIQLTALTPDTIDWLKAQRAKQFFLAETGICEDSWVPDPPPGPGRSRMLDTVLGWIGLGRLDPDDVADPDPVRLFDTAAGEGETEDTDKAWHGLHVCLTGQLEGGDYPLAFMDVGGHPLTRSPGYQAARIFDPQETAEIADTLATFGEAGVRGNYDADRMEAGQVYPEGIWHDPCSCEYVVDAFRRLLAFLQRLESRRQGFAIQLT